MSYKHGNWRCIHSMRYPGGGEWWFGNGDVRAVHSKRNGARHESRDRSPWALTCEGVTIARFSTLTALIESHARRV